MNKWQDITDTEVCQGAKRSASPTGPSLLKRPYRNIRIVVELLQVGLQRCLEYVSLIWNRSEFLVHAADVEGLCQGIDEDLVARKSLQSYRSVLMGAVLGKWVTIPTTYAGGAKGETILAHNGAFSSGSRYFGFEHG
jgi:hypothetical protein